MIGYQTPRYKDFGCWAAKIDDIANYIPARITAVLMVFSGALRQPNKLLHYLRFTFKYSDKHASPNSGWPESALAGILDCRFGGPHYYFGEYFYKPYIGENDRLLNTSDMKKSIFVCLIAEIFAVTIITALIFAAGYGS